MKTLKEISKSNPNTYRVIDLKAQKGSLKSCQDSIEIIIDGKSKMVKRRAAYKLGLCEKAD